MRERGGSAGSEHGRTGDGGGAEVVIMREVQQLHPCGRRGRSDSRTQPNSPTHARTHALRHGHVDSSAACDRSRPRVAHLKAPKPWPARPPTPRQVRSHPSAVPHSGVPNRIPGSTFVGCPRPHSRVCVLGGSPDGRRRDVPDELGVHARRPHSAPVPVGGAGRPEQLVAAAGVVQRACGHGMPGAPSGEFCAAAAEQPLLYSLDSAEHSSHSQKYCIKAWFDNWNGLPENFSTNEHDDDNDELTQIRESVNDFKVPSYRGPNPPVGDHTYEFRLYALDAFPKVPKKPGRDRLVEAMEGHILAEAVLVGH